MQAITTVGLDIAESGTELTFLDTRMSHDLAGYPT
jgi:hypothetical protein